MTDKFECASWFLLLKSMIGWTENFWGWLTLASEVTKLTSCPFHCAPSCLPWIFVGLVCGFSLAIVLCGLVAFLWIFRSEILSSGFARAPRSPPRHRLARYLE